jgi:hypothetical protein
MTAESRSAQSDCRDRAWWRREAARAGSDWVGILATHAKAIAAWRRRHDPDYDGATTTVCPTCGAAPCINAPFCTACADADARARPAPKTIIEIIMMAVRGRGLAALKEPANLERLSRCDPAALAQIDQQLTKFKDTVRCR